MPAAIPLVMMGVSAATSAYAAHKQANASKKAAQIQVDASNKGMDYQQQAQRQAQGYAEQLRTSPLQPLQGPAVNALSQRMGVSPYGGLMASGGAQPPYPMKPQPAGQPGYLSLMGQAGAPGGGMVMLEAPTGERKAVPAEQAEQFIARGARRVQ